MCRVGGGRWWQVSVGGMTRGSWVTLAGWAGTGDGVAVTGQREQHSGAWSSQVCPPRARPRPSHSGAAFGWLGGGGALWVSGRRPSGFPAIQVGWRLRGGATLQGWGGGRQGARLPFSQVLPQVSPVPDGRAGSAPTLTFRFGSLPEATRCLMADSGKAKFPVVLCHVTFSPPARLPPEEVS